MTKVAFAPLSIKEPVVSSQTKSNIFPSPQCQLFIFFTRINLEIYTAEFAGNNPNCSFSLDGSSSFVTKG